MGADGDSKAPTRNEQTRKKKKKKTIGLKTKVEKKRTQLVGSGMVWSATFCSHQLKCKTIYLNKKKSRIQAVKLHMHTSYSGTDAVSCLLKKQLFNWDTYGRGKRRRSNRAAKFSSHELESADAGVMSRSNPCDLQTPLLELQAAACRSGAGQEPLIRLVGVLTGVNPSLTRRRSGRGKQRPTVDRVPALLRRS